MKDSRVVKFIYGTVLGRLILKIIQRLHMDKIAVLFLQCPISRIIIPWYIKKNQIDMDTYQEQRYSSFQNFFLREKKMISIDYGSDHLISPCDGWLSAYTIDNHQEFQIKGSRYKLTDLIHNQLIAQQFVGGTCLVFRLCASDYHHFCFVDDGTVECMQYIEGELHSVQPIACETFPVFSLNRRMWSLLDTEHFGIVVQTEIGALIVGGIVNQKKEGQFRRGEEKGRFELSGSTIVLFLKKDMITLRPELDGCFQGKTEYRVEIGSWIATRKSKE